MFSGIVEELGRVDTVDEERGRMRVRCVEVVRGARPGDSVAVNGCCLTIAELDGAGFAADVMPETFRRTNLGALRPGAGVNLEAAMRHDSRVGGHLVTGHVDAVGRVTAVRAEGNAAMVAISLPEPLQPLLAEKGCIAVDGISLTVVSVVDDGFTVSLIPLTIARTTAGAWNVGSRVNLEGDLVARYVQRAVGAQLATARSVVLTPEA